MRAWARGPSGMADPDFTPYTTENIIFFIVVCFVVAWLLWKTPRS